MAAQAERQLVKDVYPSKKWADKVDKMPDNQVVAVLRRLQDQGKIKT